MKTPKIAIYISGGIVQGVRSNIGEDLEGRRADKGNQNVFYDRAWVRSPKEGREFLRYLEANL